MSITELWKKVVSEWNHEDDLNMKKIAHQYAERAWMDGHVIKKTGEVVPKESV